MDNKNLKREDIENEITAGKIGKNDIEKAAGKLKTHEREVAEIQQETPTKEAAKAKLADKVAEKEEKQNDEQEK